MTDKIDELRLQRLVDGAMDEAQKKSFLATIESHPQWWRDVALAYIEEDILDDLLGPEYDVDCDDRVGNASELKEMAFGVPPIAEPKAMKKSRGNKARWTQQIILIAASLSLALLLGVRVGQWRDGATVAPSSANLVNSENQLDRPDQLVGEQNRARVPELIQQSDRVVVDDRPLREEDTRNPMNGDRLQANPLDSPEHLRFVYGDGPSRESVVVPVVDESRSQPTVWQRPSMDEFEQINRELESFGYCIDWQTEYLGGELSGGRRVVVPVQAMSLRYRGQ